MDEELKQEYVKCINLLLIDKNYNNVKRFELGIVNNNIEPIFINYLLHAFRDIESFTETQENNLVFLINKLTYGK